MPEEAKEVKRKIVDSIKIRGPSLPVQVAKALNINMILSGAFLSELYGEKIIKISNMKVGGSPLYYIQGQEHLLENFYTYMPGKEKEAFLLLKENKILEDKKQLPAIRVALRNIKDFAFPFSKDGEIFWRFHSVTEEQVREILEPPKKTEEKIIAKEIKPKIEIKQEIKKPTELKKEKPLKIRKKLKKPETLDIGLKKEIQKKIPKVIRIKEKKPKEKSEFVSKIINYLQNQNIEILEERDIKKKEFSGVVRIESLLGKIKFLCIAKDKKRITENDLRLILQKSQTLKMPALVLYQQDPNKKVLEYAEKWSSLLKLKKIE